MIKVNVLGVARNEALNEVDGRVGSNVAPTC